MSYDGSPQRPENRQQSAASASDMPLQTEWQRQQDKDHLHLLSIFYYISGGLQCLQTVGILVWFGMLANFTGAAASQNHFGAGDAALLTFGFLGIGGVVLLFNAATAVLTLYAGHCLAARQNRTLILVAAGFNCLNVPLGTALAVFTFVVLSRPTVCDLFDPGYLARLREMNR